VGNATAYIICGGEGIMFMFSLIKKNKTKERVRS
jgi:hypothetical protein